MQLTKYTDLSLRVIMYLALHDNKRDTIKRIAERYQVSRNHLVKVVHQLATLGFIDSTQGRGGGIALAEAPENIIVGDVVRAMEQSLDIIDCEKETCPLRPACLLKGVLNEASHAFLKSLDQYSIADLVRNRPQLLRLIG
ncbi:Rrf2 family transcriptional regulator [Porticoccus sp. GXU_MW_L64]